MKVKRQLDEYKNEIVFSSFEEIPFEKKDLIYKGQYCYGGRLIHTYNSKCEQYVFMCRVL